MIHQALDDQEMLLSSPHFPGAEGTGQAWGAVLLRKGQHTYSLHPPFAAPCAGWREEKNPLTGQTIFTGFFLICKMFMKNHVCLQEIRLHGRWERRIHKVSVADMV